MDYIKLALKQIVDLTISFVFYVLFYPNPLSLARSTGI